MFFFHPIPTTTTPTTLQHFWTRSPFCFVPRRLHNTSFNHRSPRVIFLTVVRSPSSLFFFIIFFHFILTFSPPHPYLFHVTLIFSISFFSLLSSSSSFRHSKLGELNSALVQISDEKNTRSHPTLDFDLMAEVENTKAGRLPDEWQGWSESPFVDIAIRLSLFICQYCNWSFSIQAPPSASPKTLSIPLPIPFSLIQPPSTLPLPSLATDKLSNLTGCCCTPSVHCVVVLWVFV